MKIKLLILTTFVATQAFAVQFLPDSQLPQDLQARIETAVDGKCYKMSELTEISTVVETVHVDNGMDDRFYTTTLQGLYRFDNGILDEAIVTVKSAEYAFQNGDNLEVSSVQSSVGNCH